METLKKISPEEARKRLQAIRADYDAAMADGTRFSALVMGLFGAGKTSLLKTCRLPVLIDCFDPRGAVVLRKEVLEGKIFIRSYWDERSGKPTEYKRWEKAWEEDMKSGFFNLFGTYAIDSMTTFTECLANEIGRREGREAGKLAIQDYNPLYAALKDLVKMSQTQECDFIATGHLVLEKDEVEGRSYAELDTFKRMKSRLPLLFTEKWVITNDVTSKGVEYKLLTAPKGRYRASTQIGAGGVFDQEEVPNVKALLKKAGLPYDDKPLLKL